jgi:hypothetical protein
MRPVDDTGVDIRRPRWTVIGLVFTCLLHAPLGSVGQDAEPPWLTNGALQVPASSHRIEHANGTPFLWLGDTAWGMFQQLTREEVDRYLDQRRDLGFTVIQSVAFWYPHGGGIDSGPHNAANAYGHRPFAGGEDAPDTAKPLVVAGGSAMAPNDYWDHADYIVAAARQRGLYLGLLPTWGRAYVTPQFGGAHEEFTAGEARTYGEFLGQRWRDEPHLIWVLGGDAKAKIHGYDKNQIYRDYDRTGIFRAMAEGIAHGVTGEQPAWDEPHPAWDEVLMTYHPDGDAPDNSSSWFHNDAWLDANGVEVWREIDEVYLAMLNDYELEDPVKPSLFLEGSYEYGSYRHACGWVTPLDVRRQAYRSFFAGGAGHTYGGGPVWAMRGSGGDYNCGYTWQDALDFPGAAQVAGTLKSFLLELDWSRWIPDGSVIAGSVGEGGSLRNGVRSAAGDTALVYFADNSQTTIRNILGQTATAYWFYPQSGHRQPADDFAADETRGMRPPDGWEDAVLVLAAL